MPRFSVGQTFVALFLAANLWASAALPVAQAADYSKEHPLKVALVVHGFLGDKSFMDSAAAGLEKAKAELPVDVKIIEAGNDPSRWQPALADATDAGYDVVIAGTFDMTGFIVDLAPQNPETKFIIFDDAPDFSKCSCSNVLAIEYQTSSAAYLAGYAAAELSKTGTLGTISGMEFPTVTNFKVGFDEGAKAARPDIKILSQVAGTFDDPAKGKEIARAQLDQGADVIFPIAGATGIGALQAVRDAHKLAVGVDSDQATIFAATDQAQADVIFTSVEKRIGRSLYIALKDTIEGKAKYGTRLLLGLPEGAVGISRNAYYEKLVPAGLRAEIDAVEQKISKGEIVPETLLK
ncbi:BMP family ABC transporter substrate-binding protein [Mesorhizobium sp. M2E.F.Ca.ET.209.01.1.1]|uniref:BMP family lipoprotein n=1 Tax=Mesorhizobium sp. M2E.F.Ca.ET.209.01.1.1 TaxID=2500526 RepID=UPI000FD6C12E|nr:BMP family ABC transporter substrate-binding protein [Mesorhizobium sp. M2E.F.Ca.ET.209.01.1.1]RWL48439.1 MAG: BMP family ABC transporter substrate-binding protein [Mesorhizobium sp.]TGS10916.1 BMP family ABC transporter substrate-binding protein [Mesorhizobium sp. M2E.F.Ca.ET.209.01.1.1]